MVWLCWNALISTPKCLKNGAFDLLLPTEAFIATCFQRWSIQFANGLLDALQSPSPPTICFFESLPQWRVGLRIWSVYLLILTNPGRRPKIYIGVATDKRSGTSTRMGQYSRGVNIPRFVQQAIDEGYSITFRGLLCWVPIPKASLRIPMRALLYLIETALTLYFWPMVSKDKDWGMPMFCPWPRDTLPYDGCCGHFSIDEGINDTKSLLSAEEIDALDSERKLKASRRDHQTRGKERTAASSRRTRQKALLSRKWSCDVCNVNFGARNQLRHHETLPRHINNITGTATQVKNPRAKERHNENLVARRYYCSTCEYAAKTQQKLTSHLNTPKHAAAVKKQDSSVDLD